MVDGVVRRSWTFFVVYDAAVVGRGVFAQFMSLWNLMFSRWYHKEKYRGMVRSLP